MKQTNQNAYLLTTQHQQEAGYQWWWHRFTAHHRETKVAKTFFVQYLILNPAHGGAQPQFVSEGASVSAYAAMRVGVYGENPQQWTQYYGTEQFQAHSERMQVVIGDNYADDTAMFGEVQADGHTLLWNLRVNKRLAYEPKQSWLSKVKKVDMEMNWQAAGMYTEYAGSVVYDGELYDVVPTTSYGYQDTSFGTAFTNPLLTLSCNNFKNPILGTRVNLTSLVVGGGQVGATKHETAQKATIAFSYQGELYEYNISNRFDKVKQGMTCYETEQGLEWHVMASNRTTKIEITFVCPKAELLTFDYEMPSGQPAYTSFVSTASAIGSVKLYERKNNVTAKLIASFEGSDAQCDFATHG